ncbi:MAG: winged helix-turn-helix transcriptional regulator [Rhodobacteraceae bacterium]|nr:winged helix-turn-helix transcriptional regulator [Paracoccaceae bacterium]
MENRDLYRDQTMELAETFGLLADPTRLSIVIACMEVERSAGDIAEHVGVSPSLTSHHLRLLRSARILRSERRGKQMFYTMADACVHSVLNIMIDHLFFHDHDTVDDP